MIADKDTNFVYFSQLLASTTKFEHSCKNIIQILDESGVNYGFLKGTKDIWTRDFMPIQVEQDLNIEYIYDPNYLQGKKWRKIKSYSHLVCEINGIPTKRTDLIIDGGNVIKSGDAVIMTEKVISENLENYPRDQIIGKLKELFQTDKLALIPQDKDDPYGHADGMVRFIDERTVLVQGYYDSYDPKFKDQFFGQLDNIGLSFKKMKFNVENEDERSWAYMNFLQTDKLILVPAFGIPEDAQAMEQIRSFYSYYKHSQIKNVDMSVIVEDGGALNCISWTVMR